MPKKYRNTIIFGILLLSATVAYGFDDGFGSSHKVKSKHFVIYHAPQLDTLSLARQLNISSTDKLIAGATGGTGQAFDLADAIDVLFIQVCNILDMQLYSYEGKIKICRDYDRLKRIYNNFFGQDLAGMRAFYVYELNTVYISEENFKPEILGHEIAHAVISHYFVVQPSIKIQELLAGYIEYQLRASPSK